MKNNDKSRIRVFGTGVIFLMIAALGVFAYPRLNIERAAQLYTLLLLLAVIGLPMLWLLFAVTKREPPNLSLRSGPEQARFNPLQTTYNPKQYRK